MTNHKFPYRWNLSDGYPAAGIEYHGAKVFGTFISGGGSTMGYKLAGWNHIGGVEIDKQVAECYRKNHSPKYLFNEDIREFNKREDLPDELYELDLLDGSPPCSTFSMAGSREKAWGKEKQFREGQTLQTLDDLVFTYCDTIIKLQPKIFLLENVKGIIQGNAKSYSKKIVEKMTKAGYAVQVFLLNAATMGVPQRRERVFFIGNRMNYPKLKLEFSEQAITFGEIREHGISDDIMTDYDINIWNNRKDGDLDFGDVNLRLKGKNSSFNSKFLYDSKVAYTIRANDSNTSFSEPKKMNNNEIIKCGAFPTDYNFGDLEVKYLIGMSVPPVMTAQISHKIYEQWLNYPNR
jgi:DNA (cytosine-5)-methyltransferase 1